jgi:hypothetical protein
MPEHNEHDKPDESFLSRWSRRKQEARGEEAQPRAAAAPARAATPTTPACEPAKVDIEKLPRIEDLDAGSDFTVFLQEGVPEHLKRLALRRAWALDPAIRDFIEVAENQYDWNAPGGVPGFGALEAGTDVEALVQRATGVSPEPTAVAADSGVPSPERISVSQADAASSEDVASQHATGSADAAIPAGPCPPGIPPPMGEAASDVGNVAPDNATIPARQGPADAGHEAGDNAQSGARRRHGGALPT